jgi:hypothetical protein
MNRTGQIVRNSTRGERAVEKFTKSIGILAAAAAFMGLGSSAQAQNDLLYDWRAVDAASTPVVGFVPAPFIRNDADVPAALAQLGAQAGTFPGRLAVKVVEPGLTPAGIAALMSSPNRPNYVFLDYETPPSAGVTNVAKAQSQAQAIHAIAPTTFVGNFRLFPGSGDTSGAGGPGSTFLDYISGGPTGVNMANEDLYPGAPSYKNPGQVGGGTSTAPNIRSTLFTLPIERVSFVTANLPAGHKHIPYVNRFNNWGNNALDTDGNPTNGYRFENLTGNQLLSRGDFSALVAHYRLRGVDGVHLLDGGVVGYTQQQFEQDAKDGYQLPQIAAIFNGGGARVATLDTLSRVDGVLKDNEQTGVVYSGAYSLTQAGGLGRLALLVSNLDEVAHNLDIPQKIGGKNVVGAINILAGQHKLLEFTGAGTQWQLTSQSIVFTDADRSGVGVPEPVAMGGASIFAMTMLFRRRRSR